MVRTVDRQSRIWHFLICIDHEGLIHDFPGDVALQVLGFATVISQIINNLHHVFLEGRFSLDYVVSDTFILCRHFWKKDILIIIVDQTN